MNLNRFQRSWMLFKASVSVIALRKKLLVFPVVIFALTLALVGIFILPVLLQPTGHAYASAEHWESLFKRVFSDSGGPDGAREVHLRPAGFIYFAVIYFASMFSATFFNVAFYHEILRALQGGEVSIARGLRFASTRLGSILMWTLLAASVGLLIKAIEERLPWVGRLIARLIGLAWSVASVFAIPVLVLEEDSMNPLKVLSRSAASVRKTWGESLIGYVGLSFGGAIVGFGTVLAMVSAVLAGVLLQSVWVGVSLAAGWILLVILFSYVMGVAGHVYRGALYLYASTGAVAEPYSREQFDLAWRMRGS